MEIITDNKIFWIEELFHSYLSLKKILFPRIVHFGLSIIGEMSFRDLRNFNEMMRTLGYSRLISMENFRTPNFTLIAEILVWLVKRFDQEFEIAKPDTSTEEERVALIRSVAQFMATKANIKLNTKRLYQADGYAVIELLKITSLLYEAFKSQNVEDGHISTNIDQLMEKMNTLTFSRDLAPDITNKGAKLYELLGQEVTLREERQNCLNTQLELSEIESALDQAINETQEKVTNLKTQIENIASSEASLDKKIEKRKIELDRNTKRLQTLKKVKPAFLAEYEVLEVELKRLHQEYVMRFRCLSYLQHQIEELDQQEQERVEEAQAKTRRLAESLKSDDSLKLFEEEEGEGEETPAPPTSTGAPVAPPTIQAIQETANRLRSAAGSAAQVIQGRRRVYGSMNPSDSSTDTDDEFLLDDDDDDDNQDDSRVSKPDEADDNSDDDF